jgi:hypothetical protein
MKRIRGRLPVHPDVVGRDGALRRPRPRDSGRNQRFAPHPDLLPEREPR